MLHPRDFSLGKPTILPRQRTYSRRTDDFATGGFLRRRGALLTFEMPRLSCTGLLNSQQGYHTYVPHLGGRDSIPLPPLWRRRGGFLGHHLHRDSGWQLDVLLLQRPHLHAANT